MKSLICVLLSLLLLTGCGTKNGSDDTAVSQERSAFRAEVDAFCETIRTIDQDMNSIDTGSEDFASEIMADLEELESAFISFADKDFPTEYDYLESLADEAKDYMITAVDSFRDVYTSEDITEAMMDAKYEYAGENYSRACKRINVIVKFLNGEVDEDATVTTQE